MAQTCREGIAKQRRTIMYKIIMKTLRALSSASYATANVKVVDCLLLQQTAQISWVLLRLERATPAKHSLQLGNWIARWSNATAAIHHQTMSTISNVHTAATTHVGLIDQKAHSIKKGFCNFVKQFCRQENIDVRCCTIDYWMCQHRLVFPKTTRSFKQFSFSHRTKSASEVLNHFSHSQPLS